MTENHAQDFEGLEKYIKSKYMWFNLKKSKQKRAYQWKVCCTYNSVSSTSTYRFLIKTETSFNGL